MKIVVSKMVIEDATVLLSQVINKQNALPVLGDILCEVKDKQMKMTASDGEVTMSTTIQLETMEGDGRFCVPAFRLKDALSQLTEQPVTILATTESDMKFILKHESGETFFQMDNADEYPLPADAKFDVELIDIKGELVRAALIRSLFAMADDDLRPIMSGTCLRVADGSFDIVASDGHKMVKSHHPKLEYVNCDVSGELVMSRKVSKILSKIIPAEPITFKWNDTNCHIHMSKCDITFRRIDGKYPNYNSIIPVSFPIEVVVSRPRMMDGIKKVLPFTNTNSMLLKAHFNVDTLTLDADDYDLGQGATEQIPIETASEPIQIGFKGNTLLNILQKLDGLECVISMTDPSHQVLIEPQEQQEDCQVLMLIMPLLIND